MDTLHALRLWALPLSLTFVVACTPDSPPEPAAEAPAAAAAPAAAKPANEPIPPVREGIDESRLALPPRGPGSDGVDPATRAEARALVTQERQEAGLAVVPTTVPSDFPRPEGASLIETDYQDYSEVLKAKFLANGAQDEIATFYEDALPENGWTISVSRTIDDRHSVFAHKGDFEVNVDIFGGSPTRIEMVLYTPDPEDREDANS